MTTQTNGNKGNGDKAHSYNAAHQKIAVKYYKTVQGKSHDVAQTIVSKLVETGKLETVEFYNAAIAKFGQAQTREAEASARQAEAQKQAQERAKKARDDAEAKKSGDYTLSAEQMSTITLFITQGATRTTIKGYLKDICKFNKVQVERAIENLMPERAKSVHKGLDDLFHEFLLTGIKTEDEMIAYINEIGSPNFIKVTKVLLKRGEFFNALHRKYGA
jgi:hypothetical protein